MPSPSAPGRRRRTRAGARPHHRLGHLDEALADLDRALELNPSYACARERRDAVVRDRDG